MARLAVCMVGLLVGASVWAGDTQSSPPWGQWRGPQRDGTFVGATWPDKLRGRVKLVWRVELGSSYASPVLTPDRVFTVETKNKQQEIVRALDRATGKQLWEASWDGAISVPFFAARNGSWVRSSPAYDGKQLYVAGMRDVLVCLDAETGARRWRADLATRFKTPLPSFGCVCSPLVTEDAVYMQAGASVIKLNKSDGKTVWRAMGDGGGMNGSAFSSPVIRTLGGRQQLVVQTRTDMAGLDLGTGTVLWKQPVRAFRGMNILTPSVYGSAVFTSTYGGRTQLWKITEDAGEFSATRVWKNKLQGYMSSPIVIGDHAFIHLRNRKLACVDLKQGTVAWSTERKFGQYWSMIKQGEQILALDETGTLYLVKANPKKFELLDETVVSKQSSWAHLAMSGTQFAVRELKALALYEWK